MLDVIGAGLPRTGTLTLKAALERLGFGPCYHMFDHLELIDRWLPEPPRDLEGWARVFEGYRSVADWPAGFFWQPLADAFPAARVVLTVRDVDRWYVSFQGMLRARHASMTDGPFERSFLRLTPLLETMARTTFGAVEPFPDWLPGREQAAAAFHRHIARVVASLPADRLLVFDVREGWGPLCAFLGTPVPVGEPFPRLNDLDALEQRLGRLNARGGEG
jgi:hypothetical protein